MQDLQKQIDEIKKRNVRVEADKSREKSIAKKIIITLLTYSVIVIFFYASGLPNPRLNAIVPSIAFLLSTLGLSLLNNIRLKYKKR